MFTELTALLADPTLPEVVLKLDSALKAERVMRAKFYEDITPDMKAEFSNGEVIMHASVAWRHTEARMRASNLLYNFVARHGLGAVHNGQTLCAFPRNDYEPDVVFFGRKKAKEIKPDTMKFPPPDFACEVLSSSTEKRDRGVKHRDFEAHGVTEYWIIDPKAKTLEQYILGRSKRYELRLKSGTGEVESVAIKGLRLPIRALFDTQAQRQALLELLA
jgi:Uma2 family endonuclease